MGELPLVPFLVPVLGLGAAVIALLYNRARVAQARDLYAAFTLRELASRLGLEIASGDPGANLLLPPHLAEGTRVRDDRPYEWNVRLLGAPRGRGIDIVSFHRRERATGLFEVSYRTFDETYVAVEIRGDVPRFEIVSNQSSLGPIARRLPLPAAPLGDPALDAELSSSAEKPGVAALIAPTLRRFDPALRAYGIHLEAGGGWLRMRADARHASGVLHHVEHIVPLLEELAERLDEARLRLE